MDEYLDTILYIVLTIFLLLFSIFRKKKKLSEQVAGDTDELLPQSSDDWESSGEYEQNNEVKNIQNLPDLDIIKQKEHKDKETNNEKYDPLQKEELIRKKLQSQAYETRIDDNKQKEDAEASCEEIENFDLKTAIIYSEILNRKY